MNLLLARHGNTFAPGTLATWVGARNDLPLVDAGVAQAERLGDAINSGNARIAAIFCGPLQRTRRYADILAARIGFPGVPQIDERLNELDYGEWSGLSSPEVVARFGAAGLTGWEQHGAWPTAWPGQEDTVQQEVRDFVGEVAQQFGMTETVVAVSSNGRLRYFLELADAAWRDRPPAAKVSTGHVSKLVTNDGCPHLVYWNRNPANNPI